MSTLTKIADALGMSVTDILSGGEHETQQQEKETFIDDEYKRTHVHGYLRIGDRIVEINSMQELRDAVTACEVNYLL